MLLPKPHPATDLLCDDDSGKDLTLSSQWHCSDSSVSAELLSSLVSHDHTYTKLTDADGAEVHVPKRRNRRKKKYQKKLPYDTSAGTRAHHWDRDRCSEKNGKRLRKLPLKLRRAVPVPIICLKKSESRLTITTFAVPPGELTDDDNCAPTHFVEVKRLVDVGIQCDAVSLSSVDDAQFWSTHPNVVCKPEFE